MTDLKKIQIDDDWLVSALDDDCPNVEVEFPRKKKDGSPYAPPLRIHLLLSDEMAECTRNANIKARKEFKSAYDVEITPAVEDAKSYDLMFQRHLTREILFKACRKVSDPSKSYFDKIDNMKLYDYEFDILSNHFMTLAGQYPGAQAVTTSEDAIDFLKRMREAGENGAFLLSPLSAATLRKLVTYSASYLYEIIELKEEEAWHVAKHQKDQATIKALEEELALLQTGNISSGKPIETII